MVAGGDNSSGGMVTVARVGREGMMIGVEHNDNDNDETVHTCPHTFPPPPSPSPNLSTIIISCYLIFIDFYFVILLFMSSFIVEN